MYGGYIWWACVYGGHACMMVTVWWACVYGGHACMVVTCGGHVCMVGMHVWWIRMVVTHGVGMYSGHVWCGHVCMYGGQDIVREHGTSLPEVKNRKIHDMM